MLDINLLVCLYQFRKVLRHNAAAVGRMIIFYFLEIRHMQVLSICNLLLKGSEKS